MNITQYNGIGQVAVSAIKANFTDLADSTRLCIRLILDNLFDQAIFYWELRSDDQQICSNGNLTIGGTDYSDWNGDNEYPFTICAAKLSLTLTNEVVTLPE